PATTQPGGSGLWFSLYTRTLPAATVVVAMSSSNGALHFAGAAKASGFVPMTGSAPKVGTMVTPRVAEVTKPITPRSAAILEYQPAAPKWCELNTATTPTPATEHLST